MTQWTVKCNENLNLHHVSPKSMYICTPNKECSEDGSSLGWNLEYNQNHKYIKTLFHFLLLYCYITSSFKPFICHRKGHLSGLEKYHSTLSKRFHSRQWVIGSLIGSKRRTTTEAVACVTMQYKSALHIKHSTQHTLCFLTDQTAMDSFQVEFLFHC